MRIKAGFKIYYGDNHKPWFPTTRKKYNNMSHRAKINLKIMNKEYRNLISILGDKIAAEIDDMIMEQIKRV